MSNNKALIPTKQQIAKYVKDAVKLENAIYTLELIIAEFVDEKDYLKTQTRNIVADAREEYNEYVEESEDAETDVQSMFEIMISRGSFWGGIIGFGFIAVAITTLIVVLAELDNDIPVSILWYAFFGGGILTSILANYRGCKNEKNSQLLRCNELISKVKTAKKQISIAKNQVESNHNRIQFIDSQLQKLKSNFEELKKRRIEFYNIGIIPPDYRTFDCVIILDHIFRNDLADTMREAIKIYEDRVFRGEVIRGIDKICTMLDDLSGSMAIIGNTLTKINSNVRMMSQDFSKFVDQYANDNRRKQEQMDELINETKLSRYAQEELAYYKRWDFWR